MNWLMPMTQSFEFYTVDPSTWHIRNKINTITECRINRNAASDTLVSAEFKSTDELNECYVRVILVATQNGVTERYPLGTFLATTPAMTFDGKNKNISIDAFSPLIEAKDQYPPIGYSFYKSKQCVSSVYTVLKNIVRCPVEYGGDDSSVLYESFAADVQENYLSFLRSALSNADHDIRLDNECRVIIEKNRPLRELNPIMTYRDSDMSILYKDTTNKIDYYSVPNVVEVVWTSNGVNLGVTVQNESIASPVSIPNRGRKVVYREVSPSISGTPSQKVLNDYAVSLLKRLSTVECQITYTHGYTPTNIGDCVAIEYDRAGLERIKAKIISQSLRCIPGLPVEETAAYTQELLTDNDKISIAEVV